MPALDLQEALLFNSTAECLELLHGESPGRKLSFKSALFPDPGSESRSKVGSGIPIRIRIQNSDPDPDLDPNPRSGS